MSIDVLINLDIASGIRKAVDADFLELGDPAGTFIQGDNSFILTVFKDGDPEDMSTLAPDLLLSFSSITAPDTPALVISLAPAVSGGDSEILTFDVSTATVELQAYLQGLLSKDLIMELVDISAPATPTVLAHWVYRVINQGFTETAPLYANLQHKIAVAPDRPPLPTDDETQGFSLGSIWLYHNIANPINAEVYLLQFAGPGAANWVLISTQTSVSGFEIVQIPFAYNSASPLLLANVVVGDSIVRASIDITQDFDDLAATLSIGTAGNNDLLVAVGENNPSTIALYDITKNTIFAGPQVLSLYLNPGTSTQGTGIATLYLNKI